MKLTYLTFFLIVGFSSCDFGVGEKLKEAKKGITEAKQGITEVKQGYKGLKNTAKNLSKFQNVAKDFEKTAEILDKTPPVSKEKMKAWMPEELDGRKRTKFSVTAKLGVADISTINMTFQDEKTKKKKIEVKIVDGAGGGIAMISPFLMIQKMQMDVENEKGYQRTEEIDGNNVLIDYKNPPRENTSLGFVYKDRFLVEIKGKDINPNDLWAFMKKLKIEQLAD